MQSSLSIYHTLAANCGLQPGATLTVAKLGDRPFCGISSDRIDVGTMFEKDLQSFDTVFFGFETTPRRFRRPVYSETISKGVWPRAFAVDKRAVIRSSFTAYVTARSGRISGLAPSASTFLNPGPKLRSIRGRISLHVGIAPRSSSTSQSNGEFVFRGNIVRPPIGSVFSPRVEEWAGRNVPWLHRPCVDSVPQRYRNQIVSARSRLNTIRVVAFNPLPLSQAVPPGHTSLTARTAA